MIPNSSNPESPESLPRLAAGRHSEEGGWLDQRVPASRFCGRLWLTLGPKSSEWVRNRPKTPSNGARRTDRPRPGFGPRSRRRRPSTGLGRVSSLDCGSSETARAMRLLALGPRLVRERRGRAGARHLARRPTSRFPRATLARVARIGMGVYWGAVFIPRAVPGEKEPIRSLSVVTISAYYSVTSGRAPAGRKDLITWNQSASSDPPEVANKLINPTNSDHPIGRNPD